MKKSTDIQKQLITEQSEIDLTKPMASIVLTGEPLSTGSIYKAHCRFGHPSVYMTAAGKTLKEDYQWQIRSQFHGKPYDVNVHIAVRLYFGTKRRADWDNFHKLSMDALNGLVFIDDSQIQRAVVEKRLDVANPRIEVDIFPITTLKL